MSSAASTNRKKLYNALMVLAIVAMAAGVILGVGTLQGWFAKPAVAEEAEYPAVEVTAQDKVGNVNIERAGIAYALENGDVLRDGDLIQTLTGSSISVCYGEVTEQVPERSEVIIHIAEDDKVSLEYLNAAEQEGTAVEEGASDEVAVDASIEGVDLSAPAAGGAVSTGSAESATKADHVRTCTITISCATILDNLGNLSPGKDRFVPANGILLATSTVAFQEGDTAFDVLKRACAAAGLPLEYSWTPVYNSYYVEGIGNLYEFDCGNESGWMYQVNGTYPNYGCSSYTLKDGDAIVWNYTCNGYGADLGANQR